MNDFNHRFSNNMFSFYYYNTIPTREQVFSFSFIKFFWAFMLRSTIHLPPIEEGEFLLCYVKPHKCHKTQISNRTVSLIVLIRIFRRCIWSRLLKWILFILPEIQRRHYLPSFSQRKSCFLPFWWTAARRVLSDSFLTGWKSVWGLMDLSQHLNIY